MNTGSCNELSPDNFALEIIAAASFFSIMMAKDLLPDEQHALAQFFLAVSQNLLSIANIGLDKQNLCRKILAANALTNTQNTKSENVIGTGGEEESKIGEERKKDENF